MNQTKFKIGDVVTLKSGGPEMTIEYYCTDLRGNYNQNVHCKWFNLKGELDQDDFHQDMLSLIDEE